MPKIEKYIDWNVEHVKAKTDVLQRLIIDELFRVMEGAQAPICWWESVEDNIPGMVINSRD